MSFQLKLTSLPVGVTQYDELQFLSQCYDDQGCVTGQVDPVRDVIVGHAVAYDAVLAYLWRRLGYPNAKQEAGRLARYVLNTPGLTCICSSSRPWREELLRCSASLRQRLCSMLRRAIAKQRFRQIRPVDVSSGCASGICSIGKSVIR